MSGIIEDLYYGRIRPEILPYTPGPDLRRFLSPCDIPPVSSLCLIISYYFVFICIFYPNIQYQS